MQIYSTDRTSLLLLLRWWSPFINSSKLDVIGQGVLIDFIFGITYIQAVGRNECHADSTVFAGVIEPVCFTALLYQPWCSRVPCILSWEPQHTFLLGYFVNPVYVTCGGGVNIDGIVNHVNLLGEVHV